MCIRDRTGGENALTAYYLQQDETGLYFDPAAPFDTATLTAEHTFTGTDYPCQITFTPGTPAASLTLSYLDGTQTVTAEETLDPADLADGQTLAVPAGTASVLLTPYDAGGNPLQSQTVTQEAPSAVVCYDGGGQVLASKVLRFAWDQG